MIVAIYSSNVDPINPFPEKAGSDFFWRLSFLILHIGQMSCAMAVLGPESESHKGSLGILIEVERNQTSI